MINLWNQLVINVRSLPHRSLVYQKLPSRLLWRTTSLQWDDLDNLSKFLITEWQYDLSYMGKRLGGKRRTSNRNIVITVFHCGIVNVKTIHVHRALAVVVYVAVRLRLVLHRSLDATVLHLRKLESARDRSTIIAFTKVFLLRISSPV